MLLFSGDQDLICNVYGTQYLIGNMTWNGETGFQVRDDMMMVMLQLDADYVNHRLRLSTGISMTRSLVPTPKTEI